VPRAAIRRYVDRVVGRFRPAKVILFGSHAYGRPHPDSDVDLLVVMPTKDELNQAVRIELAVPPPFDLDLIVRTPENLARRLRWGDWFLREAVERGVVLYDEADARMAPQCGSPPAVQLLSVGVGRADQSSPLSPEAGERGDNGSAPPPSVTAPAGGPHPFFA
jgi:predicted nucleotidyltransferase